MLLANPNAHIRLPSASALDDPLSAMLALYEAPLRQKLDEHLKIIIRTFRAVDFVFTKYPYRWALGWGGFALSHLLLPQLFADHTHLGALQTIWSCHSKNERPEEIGGRAFVVSKPISRLRHSVIQLTLQLTKLRASTCPFPANVENPKLI